MTIYEMLTHDEGVRNELYKDTLGYWTIGIGHLVTKNPNKDEAIKILDKKFQRSTTGKLTNNEVQALLQIDVANIQVEIKSYPLVLEVYNSLDDTRKFALINMCFQLGVAGVAQFKNSLTLLKKKQWDNAAANLKKSLWYKQTTNRANRVISIFQTGTANAY